MYKARLERIDLLDEMTLSNKLINYQLQLYTILNVLNKTLSKRVDVLVRMNKKKLLQRQKPMTMLTAHLYNVNYLTYLNVLVFEFALFSS